ncbi:MAG: hypothetical protein OS130_10410 [Thermodesulfobacteriota bacterium]|nr:MAG: hypothetical protein OS130_10410 [Thermodesulfobacteriota bacterium]
MAGFNLVQRWAGIAFGKHGIRIVLTLGFMGLAFTVELSTVLQQTFGNTSPRSI